MSTLLPVEFRVLITGPVRRYFLSTLLSSVGMGLVLALTVVYVHNVRHFSITFGTGLLVINALLNLAVAPLVGTMTDRVGPTRVMILGMCVQATGLSFYAFASTRMSILLSLSAVAVGGASVWGPSAVLLARLVSPEQRQRAYGFNFMLLNLGIGLGALISSTVVNLHRPSTFEHLYLATGAFTLLSTMVVATLWKYGQPIADEHAGAKGDRGGWREVLSDRRLLHYIVASCLLLICGYGSLDAGLSLYIVNYVKDPVHFVGVIFFFNTLTIVIAQLFILRHIEGRSRTRILGVVGLLWGLSWLITGSTALLSKGWGLPLFCVGSIIFALGETLWSPVAPALVNQMAPEALRGRYNASAGLTWGLAGSVAPLVTGLFLDHGEGGYWPLFVGGGALMGGLVATTLRRSLSSVEDGTVAPSER